MNVSPNELRKETAQTLKTVEEVIRELEIEPTTVDEHGNSSLAPLLLAKAQCLNTLTLLNEKR